MKATKKDTISAIEKLLNDAKTGRLTGAVFSCKFSTWHRGVYALGDYANNADEALEAVTEMSRALLGIRERQRSIGMLYRLEVDPVTGQIRVPFCTDGSARVLGLTPERLQQDGNLIESIIHHEDLPRLREYSAQIARTGGLWEKEYRVLHRGGRVVPVLGRAEFKVLPNGNRQIDGVIM